MVSITRGVGIGILLWAVGTIPASAQYGDKAYTPPPNPAAAPTTQQPMIRQPAVAQPAVKETKQPGKPMVNELPSLAPQLITPAAQPQRVAPVATNAPRDLTADYARAAGAGQQTGAKGQRENAGRGSAPGFMQPAAFIAPYYLNETPNYLLAPLEPAPAEGRMPILSREPTLFGAPSVREPIELPVGGQAYGLSLNALPILTMTSLELKILKLDEAKIVDLSLPILDLTQPVDSKDGGPFGGGFMPYRVLPWPGVSTHTAAPAAPPQQAGYNPFFMEAGIGNIGAIGNIANTISSLTGTGGIGNIGNIGAIGNIGGLGGYGLPALPRY